MANGFLDIINRTFGNGTYGGDEFGGASGATGRGLPTGSAGEFAFATGIECSNPRIANGTIRRDQLAECGHYDRWREDFDLVRGLGLKMLRYGLPNHLTHLGPGRYDWSFADQVMPAMRERGIKPILDLLHFGLPDWLGDFQNPELPVHFAAYAGAVAERYPWVRHWTPVNEIYVTARISAKDGLWNEGLRTDLGFVNATKHLVAASIMATQAIVRHRPDAVIVQSESAEYTHEARVVQSREVRLINKQRFLALDLLYGHAPDAEIMLYLLDNGMTRAEFDWFMQGEPPGHQIMGNDYYGRNEHIITPDGGMLEAEDVMGWYAITHEYYQRYKRPVMHTETNVEDPAQAPAWLWKQWMNILRMRGDGVPVLGFTWYSLTDQMDWDSQMARKDGKVFRCGLYDLDRKPRPVADAYRKLIQEFGRISIMPHGEMFEVTDQPARLKVAV